MDSILSTNGVSGNPGAVQHENWSARRDLNPRPSAWEDDDGHAIKDSGRCMTLRRVARGAATSRAPLEIPGARDGIRTRDPELGKLVLYQLSYSRIGDAS
jgi:hypothetical protein